MRIKIIENTYLTDVMTFDCNATYQLPRVGEYLTVKGAFYRVVDISHNLDAMTTSVFVKPK